MAFTLTENKRILFQHISRKEGPTLVAIAAIHGNEPASLTAIKDLFGNENFNTSQLRGNVIVLVGNQQALARDRRYIAKDLNRIWKEKNLTLVRNMDKMAPLAYSELEELAELDQAINGIVREYGSGELVFIDLHTTSSDSCPFLPFNDALINRKLARHFPVPLVLGIEEFLDGTVMSHINDLGFPALGFEGGRHDDPLSVERHKAFVQLCMHHLQILPLENEMVICLQNNLCQQEGIRSGFYEILYRYPLIESSRFIMNPGFQNFQRVKKGLPLATKDERPVTSKQNGMVFLPLYQEQGQEGFFIVRPVSGFWLWLSKVLRKTKLPDLLVRLPGISPKKGYVNQYKVNPKIALWLRREIFHLFGFRIIFRAKGSHLVVVKRD